MSQDTENEFSVQIAKRKASGGRRVRVKRPQSFLDSLTPRRGGRSSSYRNNSRRTVQRSFHRRVIVQASIKRMAGAGAAKLKDHLSYLERDATQKDASPGKLYGSLIHDVGAESFRDRCKDDRHHFRFVVSPEDAEQMTDLKAYTRELVSRMERDLGSKLDWVAVNHYDTAQPHTHLTVRGVRDDGKDLVIPRRYISHGMRERAEALASLELGPVSELERRSKLARTITAERMTDLDKTIDQIRDGDIVNLAQPAEQKNLWRKQLIRKRMETLRKMGLAEYEGKGLWRMSPNFKQTLARMGEQNDILKTLHRAMAKQGMEQTLGHDAIFDPSDTYAQPITGVVKSYGRRDVRQDKGFVVIESLQGRVVYAAVSENETFGSHRTEQVVTFGVHPQGPRAIDKSIATIAQDQAGIYSPVHHHLERNASEAYMRSHVRRLEALRRSNVVARNKDGTWRIPEDYLERVNDYEAERAKRLPTPLQRDNKLTLQQMETARGATWLDRALVEEKLMGLPEDNPAQASAAKRLEVLKGLGFEIGKDGKLPSDTLNRLKAMDLKDAGKNLSKSLGKHFFSNPYLNPWNPKEIKLSALKKGFNFHPTGIPSLESLPGFKLLAKGHYRMGTDNSCKIVIHTPANTPTFCPNIMDGHLVSGDREFGGGPRYRTRVDIHDHYEGGYNMSVDLELQRDDTQVKAKWDHIIYRLPAAKARNHKIHPITKVQWSTGVKAWASGRLPDGGTEFSAFGATCNDGNPVDVGIGFNPITGGNVSIIGDTGGEDVSDDRDCGCDSKIKPIKFEPIAICLQEKVQSERYWQRRTAENPPPDFQ